MLMAAEYMARDCRWLRTGQRRPHFAHALGPGQESVWDYPRPPALVPETREAFVSAAGVSHCKWKGAAGTGDW
jgi:hypothetical protein